MIQDKLTFVRDGRGKNLAEFVIIELTNIPLEIEYREEEKVLFSNLVLEYFRAYNISIELICTSCVVADQLFNGMPHFYILLHFVPNTLGENQKETIIDSFLCVLHRMGYVISFMKGEKESLIPQNLLKGESWLIYNGNGKPEHHLLESEITFVYNNLIAEMSNDIPDSLFSILLYNDGNDVKCSIRILSKEEEYGKHIYFSLIQGLKTQCVCKKECVKIKSLYRFLYKERQSASTISYGQLSNILQLPFGERCGMPLTPIKRRLPVFKSGIINGTDVSLGTIVGYDNKKITLPLQKEVTHMSVLGISGSGKSNFLLYYLNEMYNTHNIPFMVIDPISTEYRKLKGSLRNNELKVFTPGAEISPFEFNLFALCSENLTVKEYKYILKDYLRNCLNLFAPLDKLVDETIDSVFRENGWFDISTKSFLQGKPFTLNDVIVTFNKVFLKSEFTGNLKNIASSGRVRLSALSRFFDTVAALPLEEILTAPTVIELGKLRSVEAKSTLLLYMLNMVKLYMMDSVVKRCKESKSYINEDKRPRLILVIDEAHSILEMQEQGEGMNVAQHGVVDVINQLLLEYRKYGLVVVVADQRVSVLQDVLTNTHMQVIFKQIDPHGKQVAADIISLNETQMLADQKIGQAFVKHPDLEIPVQIITPKYEEKNTDISDTAVEAYMKKEFWGISHIGISQPFMECAVNCPYKDKCCNRFYRNIASNLMEYYLTSECPNYEETERCSHECKQ